MGVSQRVEPFSWDDVTVPPNWREETTLSLMQAGKLLKIGRNQVYDAARREEIQTIRIGRAWRVSVPRLKRMIDGEAA